MGALSNSKFFARPVAVPFNVFTIKEKNVSIGAAPRGTEIATVIRATPLLSETFTAVTL